MISIKKINVILILITLVSIMTISYFTFLGGSKYEINSMDNEILIENLVSLSQIGEHRANLIVENKPYESLEDIKLINGIGEETYKKVDKYFRVGGVIR